MNILITGATGFLGCHLALQLKQKGHRLICLKRTHSSVPLDLAGLNHVMWFDYTDDDLEDKVAENTPDVLIHAAWGGVRGAGRDDAVQQEANIEFSKRLFDLYPYRQIIAFGSQAEYGQYGGAVSEGSPLNPFSAYGRAKVKCCRALIDFCREANIEWQWIRVFTVYGERQGGGLIYNAIRHFLTSASDFLTTDGFQSYSYLYAADYAEVLSRVVGCYGKSGIYNLSQPRCLMTNREVLGLLKKLTGSNAQLRYGAIPYPEGQVMVMDGSVKKFESAFGEIPYTDFEKTLIRIIDYYRHNG